MSIKYKPDRHNLLCNEFCKACCVLTLDSSQRLSILLCHQPWSMGPERPSGCGAIAISEYIPRSCRAGYSGDGRCIRSQCGNTGCKAANHLFNTRDFRKRGICLGKRLDASVESGYALNECNFATCTNISLLFYSIVLARNPVPSRSRREPLGEPILEEEASNEETRIRSVARTCH